MAVREEESRNTQRFPGKPGDLFWGKYDYYVTRTQKNALEGIWYMLSSLPKAFNDPDGLPQDAFYSQSPKTGDVIIGLNHESITIHRSGRITSNKGR